MSSKVPSRGRGNLQRASRGFSTDRENVIESVIMQFEAVREWEFLKSSSRLDNIQVGRRLRSEKAYHLADVQ
jgi:hypothetical protein